MAVWIVVIALAAAACMVVMCAPVSIVLKILADSVHKSASLVFSWGHPYIIAGSIALQEKKMEVVLFNKFRLFSTSPIGEKAAAREAGQSSNAAEVSSAQKPYALDGDNGANARGGRGSPRDDTAKATKRASLTPQPDAAEEDGSRGVRWSLGRIKDFIHKPSVRRAAFFLRQWDLYGKLLRWLGRFPAAAFRLVSLHSYNVDVRAGFEEPAATGSLFGAWIGVKNALVLPQTPKRRLTLEPVFDGQCLEIRGWVRMRTSLLRFAALAVVALATFPYLSAWRVWRRSGKLA